MCCIHQAHGKTPRCSKFNKQQRMLGKLARNVFQKTSNNMDVVWERTWRYLQRFSEKYSRQIDLPCHQAGVENIRRQRVLLVIFRLPLFDKLQIQQRYQHTNQDPTKKPAYFTMLAFKDLKYNRAIKR